MIGSINENKSSNEEMGSALQMISKLLGNGTGSVILGLESSCSLFADSQGKK